MGLLAVYTRKRLYRRRVLRCATSSNAREAAMPFILSNYGHRLLRHLDRDGALDVAREPPEVRLLCRLFAHGPLPPSPEIAALVARWNASAPA